MRPLFPVLRRIVDCIPPENLLSIKEEWIGIERHFLERLVEMDDELGQSEEPAFHCFIVQK